MAVEYVGMDVGAKFGDTGLNRYRDIRSALFVMDDDQRHPQTQVITFCLKCDNQSLIITHYPIGSVRVYLTCKIGVV